MAAPSARTSTACATGRRTMATEACALAYQRGSRQCVKAGAVEDSGRRKTKSKSCARGPSFYLASPLWSDRWEIVCADVRSVGAVVYWLGVGVLSLVERRG